MSYSSHDLTDTIVALATPPGSGAIGVIRLSGNHAISIIDGVFPTKNLTQQATHTLHFGKVRDDDQRIIDEVVVSLFVAPKSYTGEHVVEISCHGSNYIIQQLIELFIKKGARLAQPGEFTMRAFLNGKMDLSQAEAVADLIASNSASAHQVAMQQMRGGFSAEIKKLREELINFASLIELELDFGEEDVEFADRQDLKDLIYKIQQLIRRLIESFKLGNAIKNGVSTVIAGRPNAGKSTLLNALLNEERAIVSDIAGTTRDTIEEILNVKGVEFRLIDTAGIREAQDKIEAVGVEKTLEKVQQAAILVYVFDVLETRIDEALTDISKLQREGMHLLIVCNKMDKNPYFRPNWLINPTGEDIHEIYLQKEHLPTPIPSLSADNVITLSALNGMNVPYLKEKLYDSVLNQSLNLESTVVSNARHFTALQEADESLNAVLVGMENGVTSDFVAMDIRRALHHLGEIVGAVSTDDLLGNIFSNFCIGK
ncbi:MAG: tRNA uridine-5-carboxymethylaminomethyl(34) synthesis GTPase MnmE [Saprospiraceae bacterium]